MSFRDDDEFDPAIYAVGGGLPGMLWRALQQQKAASPESTPNDVRPGNNFDGSRQTTAQPRQSQPGASPLSTFNGATEFNPDSYVGSQGALLDWLRASQIQKNQYFPADGIDFDYLARLIQGHELGDLPLDTKNPKSSATGPGQFTDGAWNDIIEKHRPDIVAQYPPVDKKPNPQLLALRSNPVLANDMTKELALDNAHGLEQAGLPVTPGNIYLAHFAGFGGAKKLLRADPSAPVESVLDQKAINANPFLNGMNVGDVRAWGDRQIEVQARAMRSQKATAFQRALSTPQQPPAFLEPVSPDPSVAPPQTAPSEIRRLVGQPVRNQ